MIARRNLLLAMVIAVLLHCLLALCVNSFFRGRVEVVEPIFKSGESSLELTIEHIAAVEPVKEPKPEPIAEPEPVQEPEPVLEPEPPPDLPALSDEEEPEPESQQDNNADLLEKGVEAPLAIPTSTLNARYPLGARLRGEEGSVEVEAVLGASGRAVEVKIIRTSGYSALDRSALKAMREAHFSSTSGASLNGVEVTKTFRYVLVD